MNTDNAAPFTAHDRAILRNLAHRVQEIAADPVMERRRGLWRDHNSLRNDRPMMLIFPEGSWTELLPEFSSQCEEERTRSVELALRKRIYTYEHFQDDTVVEPEWVELAVIESTGWGLEPRRHDSSNERGAWGFAPVLKDESDLKKMRHPELIYDEARTQLNVARMQELFGDVLTVKAAGITHISYHLLYEYTALCGYTQFFYDVMDRPQFVHAVLRFLEEGHHSIRRQWIDLNLLSLNNDNTYQSTGGNGYCHELPASGFDPAHVRPMDLWASAESQELEAVSPRMHDEFAIQYEARLLEPFGLNGYGCCEALSGDKMTYVFNIPNLRRISISPFADVAAAAEQLKGDYIYSWKPKPWRLTGKFDAKAVRQEIRHTLEVTREHGCALEIVLKDTHMVEGHAERFDQWTQIARELIEEYAPKT